ncbi:MAG: AAA family ATPase [Lactobacillus sp.]|jgi:uncharacterized protein YhaN|nr:AAA family ATPase [Lactobacillus sp.]
MKLQQIEIKHFGNFNQQTFSLPDEPVLVFYGPNEAGKSTTVSFISQILFGFRKLNESSPFFVNYRPLGHVSPMGGTLQLTDDDDDWQLTRLWTKGDDSRRGSLTVKRSGQPVPAAVFYSTIKDIDYNFYVDNFVFNQDLLDRLGSLNQQDFLERIYYLGAAQSSSLLTLRNQLQADADRLFKKTGRKPPLNQLLKQADAQAGELADLDNELVDYQSLTKQIKSATQQLTANEEKASQQQDQLNRLQNLQKKLTTWQQYQQLANSYQPIAFKQADFEQAQTIDHQLQDLQAELQTLPNKQPVVSAAQAEQQRNCVAKANDIRSQINRSRSLKEQITAHHQQLTQLADLNPNLPAAASLSDQNLQTAKKLTASAQAKNNWQLYFGGLAAGLLLALLAFSLNKWLPWLLVIAGVASGFYGWQLKQQQKRTGEELSLFCRQYGLSSQGINTQLLTILPQYRSLQGQLDHEQTEFDEIKQQLATFEAELARAFPTINKETDLAAQLLAAEEIAVANRQQEQTAKLQAQRLQALKLQRERLNLQLQRLLQAAGVDTMAAYRSLHSRWLKNKQQEAQLAGLKEALADDQAQLSELAKRPEQFQTNLQTATEQLNAQIKNNNQLRDQLAELKVRQSQLASSQTKQAAEQQLSLTQAQIATLGQDYLADLLASKLIDSGLNYASSQRFPKMLEQAQHFFSLLTSGRYQHIQLNKKISVIRADGRIRPVQYLSRATAEQLYFALKLAFVQQIADQINLPVLIDDAFVNFDPERQTLIKQLLTSLSRTNQVIVFTAQPRLAKILSDQPIMLQKEG